jgi:P-type Ca2+ transporter type 2C
LDPTKDILDILLLYNNRDTLERLISTYASHSLRTIALLYRDFERWAPKEARVEDDPSQVVFNDVFRNMVFLGVVGIQDPLRDGVKSAIEDC